jgi:hypothetical protein
MRDSFDKNLRAAGYRRGFPSVSLEVLIPKGPKSLHGGVTIAYEGQYPLAFRSEVSRPEGENYEMAVRATMLELLLDNGIPVVGGVFILKSIAWDSINSCEIGFKIAALEATRALLNILYLSGEKDQQ